MLASKAAFCSFRIFSRDREKVSIKKGAVMAGGIGFENHNNDYWSQPRGFLTPPPSWKTNRCSPATTRSEKRPRRTPDPKGDLFHVIHKIPSGDSPYVRAKHVQLVDKDPSRAISLFWAAINSGDRVDSALKDMAVVMKQLDRSDEAIEAIKSFRHLSSPESQESLDNILLELYKQSGRIEEEIEMLQCKLKQVEEGIAFSGKRTKIARSQGKKVHIPVEKEYSRLLGNLAWAYMQQKDFRSAEENYRKALSFEPDKNKQCNLAVCLMNMNKLSEAKFLLQAVRFSFGNGDVDESYSKSYERASEMLSEFESQKNSDDNNGMQQSSPLPFSAKANNGPFTGFAYEKRADFDWRRSHCGPHTAQEEAQNFPFYNRNIPKVPYTQPRRSGDQRKGNAYGSYCRKLSFGSYNGSEQSFVNYSHNPAGFPSEMPKVIPQFSEANEKECASHSDAQDKENHNQIPTCGHKSWADMVEEDEQGFEYWKNDENLDSNIIQETTPKFAADQAEKLCQKMELIDLGMDYFTQPEKSGLSMNQQPVRRSLCFDQNHDNTNTRTDDCTSPLTTKVLSFEGGLSENLSSGNNRRRLQVFQEITSIPASPRP